MSTHTKHIETGIFYFVTFTCYNWLPLIDIAKVYDYFPSWAKQLSKRGLETSAYVIMPNHVHILFYVNHGCKDFNKVVGESKRFLAYEIIKRLEIKGETELLKLLSEAVQENEKQKGKKHQVFRLSFDAKKIEGVEMLLNILEYIHHNPLKGKWRLADDYTKYPYSSARYYDLGEEVEIELLDLRNKI
jgi:REP element-mobilizing transposase RayT